MKNIFEVWLILGNWELEIGNWKLGIDNWELVFKFVLNCPLAGQNELASSCPSPTPGSSCPSQAPEIGLPITHYPLPITHSQSGFFCRYQEKKQPGKKEK